MYRVRADMGYYNMGFLTMHLDCKLDKSVDLAKLNDETKSTFIHEYIHYIQEISTLQGIALYTYDATLIINCIGTIINKKKRSIEIPIILENENIENIKEQQYLVDVYKGDISIENSSHKKINHIREIKRVKDAFAKEIEIDIGRDILLYQLYYDDKENPINIGNYIICESMAYLVEKEIGYTQIKRMNE